MLEKLRDYLGKQIKTAYHTMLKSFRTFLPLLLAVLLIECILFTVLLSFRNNEEVRRETVAEEYNYHVTVSGLTETEMLLLSNDDRTVSRNAMCFDVIRVMKYESTYYDPTYTAYIKILTGNKNYGIFGLFIDDSLETNYNAMRLRYHDVFGTEDAPNERLSVSLSPLYTLEDDERAMRVLGGVALAAVALLSALIFFSIYKVFVNDRKFTFGLYTAFGASAHDMRTESMFELGLGATVLLLPAYYLSSLLASLSVGAAGAAYHFSLISFSAWIPVLLLTILILYFAVLLSMRDVAKAEPMKLLLAEENANLVSSPDSSFSLLHMRFPFSYEGISLLRFRRHHISLAIVSALLSVLFVFGFYLSSFYREEAEIRYRTDAHFTARFSNVDMVTEDHLTIFRRVSGVDTAFSVPDTARAADYAALLTVSGKNVTKQNGLLEDEALDRYYTGDALFISGASDLAEYVSTTYKTSDDGTRFDEDTYNVLVGATYQNKDTFSYSVGDTVTLAVAELDEEGNVVYLDEDAPPISGLSGRYFWEAAYESFSFRYITLHVVGVIEDFPSATNGVPIVMHPEVFEEITGSAPVVDRIDIRVARDASVSTFIAAEGSLRGTASRLGHCTLDTHDTFFENRMEPYYAYDGLIRTVICLFLVFIPLVWFYSQALFFRKREREFYVLQAISATDADIRKIHFSGAVMMLPVGIVSVLLSLLLFGALRLLFELFLPNVFGVTSAVTHSVSLPPAIYLVGLLVAFFSCILSALFPYLSYKRRAKSEATATSFYDEA